MRSTPVRLGCLCLAGCLLASPGWAQSTFNPGKDNTIYEGDTGNSNGAGPSIYVGRTSGNIDPPARNRRGLIRFDVSTIPLGSAVTSVSLDLTVTRIPPTATTPTVSLHRLLVDFGEGDSVGGGSGAPADPPDATWINRITPGTAWSANGGLAGTDYVAAASAREMDRSIASTPELVADVQSWVDNPASNFGWMLIGNETTDGSVRGYASRESGTVADRPLLTVVFESATDVVFADGFEDLAQQ